MSPRRLRGISSDPCRRALTEINNGGALQFARFAIAVAADDLDRLKEQVGHDGLVAGLNTGWHSTANG